MISVTYQITNWKSTLSRTWAKFISKT